jgi:transposase
MKDRSVPWSELTWGISAARIMRSTLKELALGEGTVTTKADALRMVFSGTRRMRIVMECGTHSPWVSRTLQELGHEVIVANPRTTAADLGKCSQQ